MKRYIFSHKDLPKDFPYNDYTLIRNDSSSQLDHRIWSELAGYKLLYDRIISEKDENGILLWDENEYISLNHYRRILDRNVIDKTSVPNKFQIIVSLYQHYSNYHNINDLELCKQAITEEFPYLKNKFDDVLKNNIMIPYNIGIMKVFQFKDYMKFIFKVLFNLHKKIGTNTYEERLDYIKNNQDKYSGIIKDNRIEYQARIEGFCAERLTTLYWLYYSEFSSLNHIDVYLMEENQNI